MYSTFDFFFGKHQITGRQELIENPWPKEDHVEVSVQQLNCTTKISVSEFVMNVP